MRTAYRLRPRWNRVATTIVALLMGAFLLYGALSLLMRHDLETMAWSAACFLVLGRVEARLIRTRGLRWR